MFKVPALRWGMVTAVGLAAVLLVLGPDRSTAQTPAAFILASPAFREGGSIPSRYTCDGSDSSPPLRWEGAPTGTHAFALIMDDPDAPRGPFTHWVLFDLPGTRAELAEGLRPDAVGISGRNDFGHLGYGGPCPPGGTHRYFFVLSALDVPSLALARGALRSAVERAMEGHLLVKAQLMGRYAR